MSSTLNAKKTSLIRRLMPRTLLVRFMLIIIVPTLIGQLIAVFLFYDRHWYNVSYHTSNIIVKEIESLINNYNSDKEPNHRAAQEYLNLSYQFFPYSKLKKKQPKLQDELQIFKTILDQTVKNRKIVWLNKEGKIEVLCQLKDGAMKITFPAKLLINPTTYIFVLWLIFLTIILLSVSLIFSKNQIKSILELAYMADSFGRGEEGLSAYKPSGAKEIRRAGIAFLKMKERIERQVSKRAQMLAMISHDLRTPLTRMKLQLELMEQSEETTELKEDIESMMYMINSYLDFAKGEKGEQFQIVSLNSWLAELLQSKLALNKTSTSSNIEFEADQANPKIQLKPNSFSRVIANLIDNANKYASKNNDTAKIKIKIHSTNSNVIITLEDNGSGIEDKEKELVFKAFYRTDKARDLNNSSNVGLGLAIAKEIVRKHHGRISLEDSSDLGGLLVKITLPRLLQSVHAS